MYLWLVMILINTFFSKTVFEIYTTFSPKWSQNCPEIHENQGKTMKINGISECYETYSTGHLFDVRREHCAILHFELRNDIDIIIFL